MLCTSMHKTPSPESQRIFAPGILADQVAVITGGGSGIGLATAAEMLRVGARVAICGRTADKLAAAQSQLVGAGIAADRVRTFACDIREPAQVEAFIKDVMAAWGRIDILVNNAGGQFPSPAQHISPNGFLAVVRKTSSARST